MTDSRYSAQLAADPDERARLGALGRRRAEEREEEKAEVEQVQRAADAAAG